jgi:hypothetical protein
MAGQAGVVDLHVQSLDLQRLFVELKAMEGSLQVELRRGVREAATPAVRAVQASASWSSRIPGAVKAQPFFTAKRAGVRIVVDAKAAPEARPLEHQGKEGTFRHPVFARAGRPRVWVSQPARPFFYGQIERSVEVEIAMRAVMTRVAAKGGL